MKLYHGTSAKVAVQALVEGLRPRGQRRSNWKTNPSSPDHVYLTAGYAAYFAATATPTGQLWGIVEVDTDLLESANLRPDEDFLEQTARLAPNPNDELPECLSARTRVWRERMESLGHMWEASVKGLGTCAHKGAIPAHAVTRVALYDPRSNPAMTLMALDPTITLVNYALCGHKYRELTTWLMGDDINPRLLTTFKAVSHPDEWAQLSDAMDNRRGLTVWTGKRPKSFGRHEQPRYPIAQREQDDTQRSER